MDAHARGPRRLAAAALLAAGLAVGLAVGAARADGQQPERIQTICGGCHQGLEPTRVEVLGHADSITCLSCHHIGFTNDPGEAARRRVDACASCHADLDLRSVHPEGTAGAPACTSCHTLHVTRGGGEGDDPGDACASCHVERHPLHAAVAEPPACAACHAPHPVGTPAEERVAAARSCRQCHTASHPSHVGLFGAEPGCARCHAPAGEAAATLVGSALTETCLSCHTVRVAHRADGGPEPSCRECHDFASDPPLDEAGPVMSLRCGGCHPDALADFEAGGHAAALDPIDPDPALPTCVSCHGVHAPPAGARGGMRLAATRACVDCHSDPERIDAYSLPHNVGESYTDDVHGATVQFLLRDSAGGSEPPVLVCSDCHGPHRVGWFEGDSLSTVCLECHTTAGEGFAGAWLGHDPVGPRNRILVWGVRLFYYVLIPFVLGGLAINIGFHLIDQRRRGAHPLRTEGVQRLRARLRRHPVEEEPTAVRFDTTERVEHLGAMVSFFLLVFTGLPQTLPGTAIGQWVIGLFGGIGTTRLVHRIVGFAFVALLVVHVGRGVARILRRRRLPDITPGLRDFTDLWGLAKHYVRGLPRPKAGRFDASEKFEYWGLVLGGTIMSVTGLVLVFPELVSQLVPGIVVAAMRTMHGLEATFAVLVIVLWHSYGVIFRPEVFPLDTTMFTGKISLERMREEHALEYEERFGSSEREPAGLGAPSAD